MSRVFVALYDLSPHDQDALDRWEGADTGLYDKLHVRVSDASGDDIADDTLAVVYVLDAYEGGLPSARYVGIIGDAAEKAGAPDDYVKDLRTRPCKSIGR